MKSALLTDCVVLPQHYWTRCCCWYFFFLFSLQYFKDNSCCLYISEILLNCFEKIGLKKHVNISWSHCLSPTSVSRVYFCKTTASRVSLFHVNVWRDNWVDVDVVAQCQHKDVKIKMHNAYKGNAMLLVPCFYHSIISSGNRIINKTY